MPVGENCAGVWNGRIVSKSTLSSRITAARHAIGDSGEAQRLIRTVARKGFRFVGTVQIEARQAQDRSATNSYGRENSEAFQFKDAARTLSDRPSIAVLPFANFSADPTKSISSTALSKMSSMHCRNSAGFSSSRAAQASSTKGGL